MSRLATLEGRNPAAGWRLVAWVLIALLAGMAVWANFAQLDEVSVAPGEVVPQGRVKTIQHLEGGIIMSIEVAEGDVVRAGDRLVQIDLGLSPVNQAELDVKLDSVASRAFFSIAWLFIRCACLTGDVARSAPFLRVAVSCETVAAFCLAGT